MGEKVIAKISIRWLDRKRIWILVVEPQSKMLTLTKVTSGYIISCLGFETMLPEGTSLVEAKLLAEHYLDRLLEQIQIKLR